MTTPEPSQEPPRWRSTAGFEAALEAVRVPIGRVAHRIRFQRFIDALAASATGALGLAGATIGMVAAGFAPAEMIHYSWLVAVAAPLLLALMNAARGVSSAGAAGRLDSTHEVHSRFRSALEFASVPASARTPFMHAAVVDAGRFAPDVDPAVAAPLRWPRVGVLALAFAVILAIVSYFDGKSKIQREIDPEPPAISALLVHPDDLESFEEPIAPMLEPEAAEPIRGAAEDFNQLIEDLADRRLDRTEALRRIDALERRLAEARAASSDTIDDALRRIGEPLRAEVTEAASQALRDGDAARATAELRSVAERLRQGDIDRRRLEQLRRALRRASQDEQRSTERELARMRQEQERLLARERNGALTPRERRLLNRRRRNLERLERNAAEEAERRRELERLRREFSQAAEDLQRNSPDEAAQALERGAEDLNRAAQSQMSETQRQELMRQLDQLRELMRRQGRGSQGSQGQNGRGRSGGQGQGQRMDRFVLRAAGQGGEGGIPLHMPSRGDQNGSARGSPRGSQGQPGSGSGQQGRDGDQRDQNPTKALTLGAGGDAQLEIPGVRHRGGGRGQGRTGPGAGVGSHREHLEEPTRIDATRRNTQVDGEESDEGASRSEVILGAADRGFAARSYQRVYTDYSDHAEEVLERDEIPGGYRFYVRRYFQLIRPREAGRSPREENGDSPR